MCVYIYVCVCQSCQKAVVEVRRNVGTTSNTVVSDCSRQNVSAIGSEMMGLAKDWREAAGLVYFCIFFFNNRGDFRDFKSLMADCWTAIVSPSRS